MHYKLGLHKFLSTVTIPIFLFLHAVFLFIFGFTHFPFAKVNIRIVKCKVQNDNSNLLLPFLNHTTLKKICYLNHSQIEGNQIIYMGPYRNYLPTLVKIQNSFLQFEKLKVYSSKKKKRQSSCSCTLFVKYNCMSL